MSCVAVVHSVLFLHTTPLHSDFNAIICVVLGKLTMHPYPAWKGMISLVVVAFTHKIWVAFHNVFISLTVHEHDNNRQQ